VLAITGNSIKMRSSTIFRFLAVLTSAAAAPVPGCGFAEAEQCVCPVGTEYQFVTAYAIFGVNARDFQQLTADCIPHQNTHLLGALADTIVPSQQHRLGESHPHFYQRSQQHTWLDP
jgi:hypothetical protein